MIAVEDGFEDQGLYRVSGFCGGGGKIGSEEGVDRPDLGPSWRGGGRIAGLRGKRQRAGQRHGSGQVEGPHGVGGNALGVDGELAVEQLQGAVAEARRNEEGDLVAHALPDLGPGAGNERFAARGAGSGEMKNGQAGNRAGGAKVDGSAGQKKLVKLDLRGVEGREVATKAAVPAGSTVGLQGDDGAVDRGTLRDGQLSLDVDGVEQAAQDGFVDLHTAGAGDLDLQVDSLGENGIGGGRNAVAGGPGLRGGRCGDWSGGALLQRLGVERERQAAETENGNEAQGLAHGRSPGKVGECSGPSRVRRRPT